MIEGFVLMGAGHSAGSGWGWGWSEDVIALQLRSPAAFPHITWPASPVPTFLSALKSLLRRGSDISEFEISHALL